MNKVEKIRDDAAEVLATMCGSIAGDGAFLREALLYRDAISKKREIQALRDAEAEELEERLARIEAAYDPALEVLTRLGIELRERLEDYADEKVREQSALLAEAARLGAAGEREKAEDLLRRADAILPPAAPGVGVSRRLSVEIEDAADLPDEYVLRKPLLAKIRKVLREGKDVPGARAETRARVGVRGRKAKK